MTAGNRCPFSSLCTGGCSALCGAHRLLQFAGLPSDTGLYAVVVQGLPQEMPLQMLRLKAVTSFVSSPEESQHSDLEYTECQKGHLDRWNCEKPTPLLLPLWYGLHLESAAWHLVLFALQRALFFHTGVMKFESHSWVLLSQDAEFILSINNTRIFISLSLPHKQNVVCHISDTSHAHVVGKISHQTKYIMQHNFIFKDSSNSGITLYGPIQNFLSCESLLIIEACLSAPCCKSRTVHEGLVGNT